jgi:UDP-N-acetylmuramoyl-tripeptide--D-alanyl-D-alanine ligase
VRFRASEAATATGGVRHGPDVELDGASFDSRSTQPGQLFVPIVGDRDGHEFVADAIRAGAPAYLTARPLDPSEQLATAIEVADPARALLELAAWARTRLSAEVVGITGSVGKTSTKDLVAAAVGAQRRVTANERSFNNEQGLPVTILGAPDDTEVLVLEMGMRGFGQIAELCRIGRPTVGVVTAVGEAHTELVGGIEGVARAKRELVEALPASGTAVLNADDHRVLAMASATAAAVVTYGTGPDATVRLTELVLDELARPRFTVTTPWGAAEVALAVSGRHMAMNAAAALAVAGTLGVSIEAAAAALGTATVSGLRMEVRRTAAGAVVLDDTYNANPTSMRAALEALAGITASRRIAVLGEMAELEDPEAGHREIADLARSLGIDLVAARTSRYGVPAVDDPVTALGALGDGDAVLFKASRFVGLDRDVARLLDAGR